MTKEELLAKIATIKNATQKGENTAMRVGGAMEDMVSFTDEQIEKLKANTDSDFLVIDADMSPLMTEFVENGIPEEGIEIPTTIFQSIFGMQPVELCEKVFSAKHNMIRMFGSIEHTSEEGVSIIKLNTLSKAAGQKMTFNDTSLGYGYIVSIPFRVDVLKGAQGNILIQYVPAVQINSVGFLFEEAKDPNKILALPEIENNKITFSEAGTYVGNIYSSDSVTTLKFEENTKAFIKIHSTTQQSYNINGNAYTITTGTWALIVCCNDNNFAFVSLYKED